MIASALTNLFKKIAIRFWSYFIQSELVTSLINHIWPLFLNNLLLILVIINKINFKDALRWTIKTGIHISSHQVVWDEHNIVQTSMITKNCPTDIELVNFENFWQTIICTGWFCFQIQLCFKHCNSNVKPQNLKKNC